MSDADEQAHEQWLEERCPNDLGDGNHRWGWINSPEGRRNIFFLHRCEGGRRVLGTIDTSIHQLVAEDPLHVEPSILCTACGDHGFIRGGRWESA